MSSSSHTPPRSVAAVSRTAGLPPLTRTFFSDSLETKAIHWPSGEKNGLDAPCVPAIAVTAGESRRRHVQLTAGSRAADERERRAVRRERKGRSLVERQRHVFRQQHRNRSRRAHGARRERRQRQVSDRADRDHSGGNDRQAAADRRPGSRARCRLTGRLLRSLQAPRERRRLIEDDGADPSGGIAS